MSKKSKIGILALQGAVDLHAEKLLELGATPVEVRTAADLDGLRGIILPGGESTTMLHILGLNSLFDPLTRYVREYPAWGVCAGAILLANKVFDPEQTSLQVIDIEVGRNAYGRQTHSFIDSVEATPEWTGTGTAYPGVFIRAPRIQKVGEGVKVLFKYQGEAVMVEQGNCLASAFHPELTNENGIHEYFLRKCEA